MKSKSLSVVLLALLTVAAADGQWQQDTLVLPDRFGLAGEPQVPLCSPVQNKVFVVMARGSVLGIDNATGQKVSRTDARGGWEWERGACYNPDEDQLLVSGVPVGHLGVFDCATGRYVDSVPFYTGMGQCCYNPAAHKAYVICGPLLEFVGVVDCAGDSLIATLGVPRSQQYRFAVNTVNNKVYCASDSARLVVIDGAANNISASVALPAPGHNMWYSQVAGRLFVTVHDSSCVAVIDGAGDSLTAVVPVRGAPAAIDGNSTTGLAWCACYYPDTVFALTGSGTVAARIGLGRHPRALQVSPATNRVYVLTSANNSELHDTLVVIDGNSQSVIAEVELPRSCRRLLCTPNGDRVYVVSEDERVVAIVNTTTHAVTELVTGFDPYGFALGRGGSRLYVTAPLGRRLLVLDAATQAVLRSIDLPEWRELGDCPETGLAYNAALDRLYVMGNEWLAAIDCGSDSVIARMAVTALQPDQPALCLVSGHNRLWLGGRTRLRVVDCLTNTVRFERDVSNNRAYGPSLLYNPDADKVYYCGSDSLLVFDAATETQLAALPVGRFTTEYPRLVYNPTSGRVYLAGQDTLMVVCGRGDTVVAKLGIREGESFAIACNPLRNRVYYGDDRGIVVHDCGTETTAARVTISGDVTAMLCDPARDRLYAADDDGVITVLNCATNTVIAQFAVGDWASMLFQDAGRGRVYAAIPWQGYGIVLTDTAGTPPSGQWTELEPVPLEPSNRPVLVGGWLVADTLTGRLVAAKGGKQADCYGYLPASHQWTVLAPIPLGPAGKLPKAGAAATADGNGHVYMLKGNHTRELWRYTLTGNFWTQLVDVPPGLTGRPVKRGSDLVWVPAGASGQLYLLKGTGSEFWRYDFGTEEWQMLPDAPAGPDAKKWSCGSWLVYDPARHRILAHKGRSQELYGFDIGTGVWNETLAAMPLHNRQTRKSKKVGDGSDAVMLDGLVYAIKGKTPELYAFDPNSGGWFELETIPSFGSTGKRRVFNSGAGLAALNGVLYALKGKLTREFWRYQPASVLAAAGPQSDPVAAGTSNRIQLSVPSLSRGTTTIRWSGAAGSRLPVLRVYDPAGRVITVHRVGPAGTMAISGLRSGVYLIELGSVRKKLVVSR